MIEVEILGAAPMGREGVDARSAAAARAPSNEEIRQLCVLTTGSAGLDDGHVAIEFVDARRIAELNGRYRSKAEPTDVLSFPVDGTGSTGGARELGDVVICLEHTADVREAIVHGVLHLLGMDHETDEGEMLSLQRELLARARVA